MAKAAPLQAAPEEENKGNRRLIIILLALLWLVASGISIYLYISKNKVEAEKQQVEKLKADLDKEILQLNQALTNRESELASKDNAVKELSMKLQQAETIKAELDRMRALSYKENRKYTALLREKQSQVDSFRSVFDQMGSELTGLRSSSEEKDKTIKKLELEKSGLQSEVEERKSKIEQLERTLNNVYVAYDFDFYDDKNQMQLLLNKSKVKKKMFTITFKLGKHDRSPVPASVTTFSCHIKGVKLKKGSFNKEYPVKHGGGNAKLTVTQESLPPGIYQVLVKFKDKEIGDASFMVK